MDISIANNRSSIDPTPFWLLVIKKCNEGHTVEKITEEDVKSCIMKRPIRDASEMDLGSNKHAIRNVRTKINISDARNRIDILTSDYIRDLENDGLQDYITKCP